MYRAYQIGAQTGCGRLGMISGMVRSKQREMRKKDTLRLHHEGIWPSVPSASRTEEKPTICSLLLGAGWRHTVEKGTGQRAEAAPARTPIGESEANTSQPPLDYQIAARAYIRDFKTAPASAGLVPSMTLI